MSYRNVETTRGGYKEDHPQCVKKMFDDRRRKRKIRVSVTRFVPFPHYWVYIEEEDDYYWDPINENWRQFWPTNGIDDCAGFSRSFECSTIDAARSLIRRIKKMKKFKNHKFVDESEEQFKWYYKDGD